MIKVYCDYHTPTIVYAHDEDGWHIVPATIDGWRNRRPWNPAPAVAKRLATEENRINFYGLPQLAEQAYGFPADRIEVARLG